jgi:hypothetical protein
LGLRRGLSPHKDFVELPDCLSHRH